MKKTIVFCFAALLALVACTDNKLDRGDAEKCLAGQVYKEGVGCVAAGCSQDVHCDDGNPCNGLEECIAGRCSRGGVIIESCDDGIGCTDDKCDKYLARCIHVVNDELCEDWELCDPKEDCVGRTCSADTGCDDGLYCNGPEKCSEGQCLTGQLDCNDSIACTADSCSEESDRCQSVPNHKDCPVGQICSPEQGCIELPCDTDAYCDDGSFCNGVETCSNGKCMGGMPLDCDDGVNCTVDDCDEAMQKCVHTPDHHICDDRLFCNGLESCDANTGCVTGAMVTCRDSVGCTVDSCNEELDACQYDPDDKLCSSNQFCDPLNDCIDRPECIEDADCPGGMVCRNRKCIQIIEEPVQMDADDGGMPADDGDDGGYGDDGDDGGYGDDGDDGGYGDDGCCMGDDGDDGGFGDDGCCMGDDGMPGDDGTDGGDGTCDNGDSQNCDTGQPGECALGIQYCFNNTWTSCEQLHTSMPELCDARDNDCDGDTDEEEVCACLQGCLNSTICEETGMEEVCEHAPGFFNACILRCDADLKCPATSYGKSRVCVDSPAIALGPICVCEPGQCPQDCLVDSDCYPYGLINCVAGSCTSPCASGLECPLPYLCGSSGTCECDTGNIGDSCIACGTDLDCTPPAPCTYRNYETDPSTVYKECEYPCMLTEECPTTTGGDPLYCRWGEGNTVDRCACEPAPACLNCMQANPDPCEPFSMMCSTFTDPVGGTETIVGCTAPCLNDGHCPTGWYCWDDGLTNHGWCLEAGCNCVDTECGPNGVPVSECPQVQPGFMCIQDTSQDPPVNLCTMYCSTSDDCPLGFHCDDGSGTGGMSVCRCDPSASVTGH